jgi:hypothetical protein
VSWWRASIEATLEIPDEKHAMHNGKYLIGGLVLLLGLATGLPVPAGA